jgi:hypothetical protein
MYATKRSTARAGKTIRAQGSLRGGQAEYPARYAFPRLLRFRCETCHRLAKIPAYDREIRSYSCRRCGAWTLVLESMGKPLGKLRQARREVDLPEGAKAAAQAIPIPGAGEVPCFEAAGNCECEHAAGEHRQDGATELDSACFALAGATFCECVSYTPVAASRRAS